MKIQLKYVVLLLTAGFLFSCADKEESISVGLSDDEGESELAEALFCTGSSEVLKSLDSDEYPIMADWQKVFTEIHQNAQMQANSLKGNDGAAVVSRVNMIRSQTQEALQEFDANQNNEKFDKFIKQTMQQCSQFTNNPS